MPLLTRAAAPVRRSLLQAVAERIPPEHLAVGRAGAGSVMVLRPRVLPQLLGVDSATAARMGWAVQMLGAREVALGLGTLVAVRRLDRAAARTWLAAGVLSDATDVLAVGGALLRRRLRPTSGGAVLAVAAGAVVLGVRDLQRDAAEI